jgi:hypothetical protein
MTSDVLPWFKLHTSILDDEIVCLLDPEHRWYFVGLIACKRAGLLDREYPSPDVRSRVIANKIGAQTIETLMRVIKTLAELGLIDRDGNPLGFEKHQAKKTSNDSSAERTRRYRARLKAEAEQGASSTQEPQKPQESPTIKPCDGGCDVTCDGGDGTVTPLDIRSKDIRYKEEKKTELNTTARVTRNVTTELDSTPREKKAEPAELVDRLLHTHGYQPPTISHHKRLQKFCAQWSSDGISVMELDEVVEYSRYTREQSGHNDNPPLAYLARVLSNPDRFKKPIPNAQKARRAMTDDEFAEACLAEYESSLEPIGGGGRDKHAIETSDYAKTNGFA